MFLAYGGVFLTPGNLCSFNEFSISNGFRRLSHTSVIIAHKPQFNWRKTALKTSASATNAVSQLKKVLMPVAFGTEEMEAVVIVDVLRRAGAEVLVASVEPELEIEGAGGIHLIAEASISDCADEIFDLIVFPGGMPGASRLRDSNILREITTKHVEEKRLHGAICAAPAVTLLPWDLLNRKYVTGHPAFMDKLPAFWAVKSDVHVSKELTTSRGPGTSFEFAITLSEQLLGESVANDLRNYYFNEDDEGNLSNGEQWNINHQPRVLIPMGNGAGLVKMVVIADILRRAKVNVVISSVEDSPRICDSQGIKIVADNCILQAANSTYDVILLICPPRCELLEKIMEDQKRGGRISLTLENKGGIASVTGFALEIVRRFFGEKRAASVAEGLAYRRAFMS